MFNKVKSEINNRIFEIGNTLRHKKEVQRIAKSHGLSYPMHDTMKMINIALLGDKLATKLHRKYSSHHEQYNKKTGKMDIRDKKQAAIDWESARFTKPEKQLNAYETWQKYYPHIDMEDTLKQLGMHPNKSFSYSIFINAIHNF